MKKLLLISAFLVSTSFMFGQFTIVYDGIINNLPTTPIMVYLEVDSVIIDSTLAQPSTGGYIDSSFVSTRPFIFRILFYNCHGVLVADDHFPTGTPSSYTVPFDSLDYCPPSPCSASFTKHQAIDPITRLPIPNKAILVDGSVGTAMTYSWNFGDGSPAVSGLNVTHTYSTHGSYLVCLTIVSTATSGTCTSTYCDTLTVDSTGNVRSAFTVSTGNSFASIDENETLNNIKLFPNPAQENATLDFESINSSDLTIRIIDVKGSEILSFEKRIFSGNNRIQLNTTNLEEGMYLIQLQDGNSFVTKRLQIVR